MATTLTTSNHHHHKIDDNNFNIDNNNNDDDDDDDQIIIMTIVNDNHSNNTVCGNKRLKILSSSSSDDNDRYHCQSSTVNSHHHHRKHPSSSSHSSSLCSLPSLIIFLIIDYLSSLRFCTVNIVQKNSGQKFLLSTNKMPNSQYYYYRNKNLFKFFVHYLSLITMMASILFIWPSLIITASAQRILNGDLGQQLEFHNIYTRRGSNTTIVCEPASRATKIYNIQWFKDERKVVEIENQRIINWQVGDHVSFVPETGALLLRSVSFRDSGDYLCLVNNKRENGQVRLMVQDVPDPPGKPFIMSFTSRSVNLSWAPSFNSHNSPVLNYIIHTRIGENGDWDSMNGISTLDNRTEYYIDKLQPFTVYSFRVIAVNAIGASQPSKESYYTVTLREIPDGIPIGFRCVNKSSSSLSFEWHPPPRNTIHGEFIGYRLRYHKNGNSASLLVLHEREITIGDPEAKNYTIRNLEPYTEYFVTLRVFNPKGDGPVATLAATTDEGVPSPPRNVTVQRINNLMARVQWNEPLQLNGRINGYHIYVHNMAANLTEVKRLQTSDFTQHLFEYTIHNLKPFTQYKVWTKAYTERSEGEASRTIEFRTDVSGPSAPYITNLTCEGDDALIVQWTRPELFYHKIDYYFVYYRSEHDSDDNFEEIPINIPGFDTSFEHYTKITNLTKGTLYEVKVQGATRSLKESNKLYRGDFSESRKVILQSYASGSEIFSASLMAGLTCALLAFLLALASFFLWRKYFQAAYYYLDDPAVGGGGGSSNPRSSPNLSEVYIDEAEYPPIITTQWSRHVQELHCDSDIGFTREYEQLQRSTEVHADRLSSEHSHMTENKTKNRYVNIVAYDHTRVLLKPLPGQKKTGHDYINANYIDGYRKSQAYIGTQGPLPATFDDYWRMIWEQRVCIVVMITNLMERGRRKCDLYWPKDGTETYGIVQVRLLQEVVMATYTLRTFHVKNLKIKKKHGNERTVYQYHYTNWPDHGVPEHPLPVLAFIRKSAAANPPAGGPIIVHCSAGVGRTGTYIVLDAMMQQIKHRNCINVFGFLKHIRQQRNFLVQTEEQYIFIHDALMEFLDAGDTEVPSTHLLRYLQTLQTGGEPKLNGTDNGLISSTIDKHSHWPLLERQFRMVTQFKAKDFNVVSALKPCNKPKNRSLNLIPLEAHRVHILPRTPGAEGSDYINATFLTGFSRLREFIITQHPIWDTVPDFWQMIWDHNVQTIVMLSSVIDEKEFPQFWPDKEDEADYGSFKVKLIEESRLMLNCENGSIANGCPSGSGFITKRDLMLQSTQDDYELCCRLVHCADWPERQPLAQVFDLIKIVQDWCTSDTVTSSGVLGPVVVVDKFGGTEAATFSILTTLYKQLNFEDCVDVYMYAKLYHLRRPGIWRSQDDYLFLYRALEALVSSTSTVQYTNAQTPQSGSGTNVNTLTSTSSATHLMGSNTPPPLTSSSTPNEALAQSYATLPRVNSRNSSHRQQQQQQQQHNHFGTRGPIVDLDQQQQQQQHYVNQNQHLHHNHNHQQQDISPINHHHQQHQAVKRQQQPSQHYHYTGHRTPSPFMCDSPQQLLSVQATTGTTGYNSYHISMMSTANANNIAAAATAVDQSNQIVHS
ncbi:protein tyrosine phosphatase 99A isoform X4 [Dermatophagoides pteronyssinus]|uniref:protein tyrosine phosphatase 99A isoform X4 n=1 Tax=Dermatophagoides pteronyssinus TaxID=6956 RepID=UPI003F680E6E